jgi:hypothetical protein
VTEDLIDLRTWWPFVRTVTDDVTVVETETSSTNDLSGKPKNGTDGSSTLPKTDVY